MRIQHEHPDVTGGWLRPAVFGAMDGLVSNLALIAGVAGGTERHATTVACSPARRPGRRRVLDGGGGVHLGAPASPSGAGRDRARSAARSSATRRARRASWPQMYVAKGLDPELAARGGPADPRDVDNAVAVHAREELGVDPDDLASPWSPRCRRSCRSPSARSIPVLPYLLGATACCPALLADPARRCSLCGARRHPGHQPALVVRRPAADAARRRGGRRHLRRRQPGRRRRDRLTGPSDGPSGLPECEPPVSRAGCGRLPCCSCRLAWANVVPSVA